TQGARRRVPDREIRATLRTAYGERGRTLTTAGGHLSPTRAWPEVNHAHRAGVIEAAGGFTLADMRDSSPVRLDEDGPDAEEIIDLLFPGNPLLCVGMRKWEACTKPREFWRGKLGRMQFIVPSPMAAETGLALDGGQSQRCLGNVGPRAYIVTEFDGGTPRDQQAAIIGHLSHYAPLVAVVDSGGESLHAWFRAAGQPEDKVLRFFRYAVSLGADKATRCAAQFVRMPEGRRDT